MSEGTMGALVIDNGSGTIKAGFAGDHAPMVMVPSIVGRNKHLGAMWGLHPSCPYIGDEAMQNRGTLANNFPIKHGIISDWDDMEKLWHHIFYDSLMVETEEQSVLLTEPPLNPRSNREKMTEIMFETFNVPAMYLVSQAVLSLHDSGRMTGVVIDSGDDVTHVIPVYEGYELPYAVSTLRFAGRQLTQYMSKMLKERGYTIPPSYEDEITKLKEEICYVALNFQKELATSSVSSPLGVTHQLPDGNIITVSNERFRCPEALFQPSLMGIESAGLHELLHNSITKCREDVVIKDMYLNTVLSGGSALIKGLDERVRKELTALAPLDTEIVITATPQARTSAWTGGSMLASMSTFPQMCINKQDYDESGPSIVNIKCL